MYQSGILFFFFFFWIRIRTFLYNPLYYSICSISTINANSWKYYGLRMRHLWKQPRPINIVYNYRSCLLEIYKVKHTRTNEYSNRLCRFWTRNEVNVFCEDRYFLILWPVWRKRKSFFRFWITINYSKRPCVNETPLIHPHSWNISFF